MIIEFEGYTDSEMEEIEKAVNILDNHNLFIDEDIVYAVHKEMSIRLGDTNE